MAIARAHRERFDAEDGHPVVAEQSRRSAERAPLSLIPKSQAGSDASESSICIRNKPFLPVGPAPQVITELVRAFVVAHIARKLEVADLVGAAGVSESTVRRAVFAETGQHLMQFVTNIRLDQAHAGLSTNRESRSIARIGAALGLGPVVISQAYRRRFGETMSQTRRRAVQSNEGLIDSAKSSPTACM